MKLQSLERIPSCLWSARVLGSSSPLPFSPLSLLFIMDPTRATLVQNRIIALKCASPPPGNVKSDYFQWQKIDNFERAVFNLLFFVFFDIFSLSITCLIVNFACQINLLKVSRIMTATMPYEEKMLDHDSGVGACAQRVWVGFGNPPGLLAGHCILPSGK